MKPDTELSREQLHILKDGVLSALGWTPFYREKIKQVFAQALRSSPAGYERGLEDAAKLVALEAEKCEEGSTADVNGWPAAFLVIARKIRALKGRCPGDALAPAGGSTLDTRAEER